MVTTRRGTNNAVYTPNILQLRTKRKRDDRETKGVERRQTRDGAKDFTSLRSGAAGGVVVAVDSRQSPGNVARRFVLSYLFLSPHRKIRAL